jgi:hypothetical protein
MNMAIQPSPSIAQATGIRVRQARNPNPAPSLAHHATLTNRCLKPTVSRSSPCVSGRMRSDFFKAAERLANRSGLRLTLHASCTRPYPKRQTFTRHAPQDNAHKGYHITTRTRYSCPRSGTAQREASRVTARAQKSQPDRPSPEARFGQCNHREASLPTLTSFTGICTTK